MFPTGGRETSETSARYFPKKNISAIKALGISLEYFIYIDTKKARVIVPLTALDMKLKLVQRVVWLVFTIDSVPISIERAR